MAYKVVDPSEISGGDKPVYTVVDPATMQRSIKDRNESISPYTMRQKIADTLDPALKMGFGTLGAVAAAPLDPGTMGGASVVGYGLGYGGGGQVAKFIRGGDKSSLPQQLKRGALDVAEGMITEVGGRVAIAALAPVARAAGGAIKSAIGKFTGTGKAAIEEAIKSGKATGLLSGNPFTSSTEFDRALRGEYKPNEIVDNAHSALSVIKDNRSDQYRADLQKLDSNKKIIDIPKLQTEAKDIFKKYVRFDQNGNPDWDRSALGTSKSEAVSKMKEMYNNIMTWKSKGEDATPSGLDMLKRQLDDFYAESSNARALTTSLRNKVKDTLVKNVPEYAQMTKGYSEATELIKDIESGLMMRKKGMTGRITADQTLRRLSSAMKENFELRKDLVNVLGYKGAKDISGQIAGYVMSSPMPRGLRGSTMAGEAALIYAVNPKFWPVLAASSPRVVGEFLRLFGKASSEFSGTGQLITRGLSAEAAELIHQNKEPEGNKKWKTIGGDDE